MSFLSTGQENSPDSPEADSTPEIQEGPVPPHKITILGTETILDGLLTAQPHLQVNATVHGEIHVEGKVLIAEDGVLEGDLVATRADLAGMINGDITVGDLTVLRSTARIDGDIETERLVIEEGAAFTGRCRMTTDVPPSEDTGT